MPPRKEIATLARGTRDVFAMPPQPGNERSPRTHADVLALSRMILDPILPLVQTARVAFVAPGPLAMIPFAAMPVLSERPRAEGPVLSERPRAEGPVLSERTAGTRVEGPESARLSMVQRYEVVNLPSATVLSALRRAADRRTPPSRAIAVFADPVYDAGDSAHPSPRV